ncbi:MAG: 1-phosphofructokinase family hexose kinase, partial [Actinobacteria bacterium]|nr:1-phosphofructokinase family hexose kinase [Actinomycetota bacterium]
MFLVDVPPMVSFNMRAFRGQDRVQNDGGKMIYTITLNPTLDITYVVDSVKPEGSFKAREVIKTPGGKGINVSKALMSMGVDSTCMGLMGGYSGQEATELLQKEGLILQMVKIASDTRTNVVIFGRDNCSELIIRAEGPTVEEEETQKLADLFLRIANAPEVLVLSGSLPRSVRNDIYYSIIQGAKERGAKVFLDASGEPMKLGIEAVPYLIKPNKKELEELAGRTFKGEEEVIDYSHELNRSGIEMVLVSMGREGAILVTGEGTWKGVVPVIKEDTVGAGDSMVAGFAFGLTCSKSLEETFHMALAWSVSAVMNAGPWLT